MIYNLLSLGGADVTLLVRYTSTSLYGSSWKFTEIRINFCTYFNSFFNQWQFLESYMKDFRLMSNQLDNCYQHLADELPQATNMLIQELLQEHKLMNQKAESLINKGYLNLFHSSTWFILFHNFIFSTFYLFINAFEHSCRDELAWQVATVVQD